MDNNSIENRFDRMEKKIDALLELFEKRQKIGHNTNEKPCTIDEEMKNTINQIFERYKIAINKKARLIQKAEQKITARLKEYTFEELNKGITNFAADSWWMKHNAHRGIAWFFHSEDRIEQFINLIPQKEAQKLQLIHNEQPCKYIDHHLKIYAPWSGNWLDWNKNHPQFEKFTLKEDGKIISTGYDAYLQFIKTYGD